MADAQEDKVWIPDSKEVWKPAVVVDFDPEKKQLEVVDPNGKNFKTMKISSTDTLSYDPDHSKDFNNAFSMGDLNEAALLSLLQKRSLKDQIYTFTGDVLLSVNPYRLISGLYEPMPSSETLKSLQPDANPHLYVLAERTYHALFNSGIKGTSQAVLINGESGAGKTEAAKRIMAFLMELSQRKRAVLATKKKGKNGRKGGGRPKRGNKKKNPSNVRNSLKRMQRFKAGIQDSIHRIRRVSKRDKDGSSAIEVDEGPIDRKQAKVEKIILRTNPLLEAFGNARTIRNDNSSRFGKFVQLEYDQDGVIQGARTRHFLLEKSRITTHGRGERNYHIFYQLCAAVQHNPDDPAFQDLHEILLPALHYNYLNPFNAKAKAKKSQLESKPKPRKSRIGKPVSRNNRKSTAKALQRAGVELMAQRAVDYLEKNKESIIKEDLAVFQNETSRALDDIKLELQDKRNVWKVLAGILLLGNLEFKLEESVDNRGMTITETVVDNSSADKNLETCAKMLGVAPYLLANALVQKTIRAGHRASVTVVGLGLEEAKKSRDGLAKAMYEALFEWMLDSINRATGSAVEQALNAIAPGHAAFSGGKKKKVGAGVAKLLFIGILDIFGFEMLEDNSFEQLCINYANETLQGMFDQHVFELEKEAYEDEGIEFNTLNIQFRDNLPLLQLINQKQSGIFQLMDEQGALGARGSDGKFYLSIQNFHATPKMSQNHRRSSQNLNAIGNKAFAGAEQGLDGNYYFSVNHFAGVVRYTASGMIEKNADHLQADLFTLIMVGGVPVDVPEITAEEKHMTELQMRMNKKPRRASILRPLARKKSKEEMMGATPQGTTGRSGTLTQITGFPFLQKILKLREERSKLSPTDDQSNVDSNAEGGGKKKKRRGRQKQSKMAKLHSVSARFRKQMSALQVLLSSTEQHFVRCIKPNDLKLPPGEHWDAMMVNSQLKMLGALEMVRVRREGYPIRTTFEEFLPKFPELIKKHDFEADIDPRKAVVAFLNLLDKGGKNKRWCLGDNKLFIQETTFKRITNSERQIRDENSSREEKLRKLREQKAKQEAENAAQIKIAKNMRMVINKAKLNTQKKGFTRLQAVYRRRRVKPLQSYIAAIIVIQRLCRGHLVRNRYGTLSVIALKLNPAVRGFLLRKKMQRVFETKKAYKSSLRKGEGVVLESYCIAERTKRKNATLTKTYCLILTSGPDPRILYVNRLTGKLHTELVWDDRVLCALMANEHKIILYTKPPSANDVGSGASKPSKLRSAQTLFRFVFARPVAALWLLALKECYTVPDLLALKPPNYNQLAEIHPGLSEKIVRDHGNLAPLDRKTKTTWMFGGEGVLGGLLPVSFSGIGNLNQLKMWRQRFFVLKETTLFWFKLPEEGSEIEALYPSGGINLSSETTINMASTKKQFFNKDYKQKASLEIENRVLRKSLKMNLNAEKSRQKWVSKMRNAVKRKLKDGQERKEKRASVSYGMLNDEGFTDFLKEEPITETLDGEEPDSESEDLRPEDPETSEDIEQGFTDDVDF